MQMLSKSGSMIRDLVRPHIRSLIPYSSARSEFEGTAEVLLDANENPHDFEYSRYPDPDQRELKQKLSHLKAVATERLFIGNGSDEIIDILIRSFCIPNEDTILTYQPSFSMYDFSAALNQIEIRAVALREDFSLDLDLFLESIRDSDKIIFLCSPNNPTGNIIVAHDQVRLICAKAKGLVVVDEAYIDFAEQSSVSELNIDNLVVLQTFSKSYGSAGIRLGIGIAHPEVIHVLKSVKLPYNVSEITQRYALKLLDEMDYLLESIDKIKEERNVLLSALKSVSCVEKVFPTDSNFFLIRVSNAKKVYDYLVAHHIIVRDRSKELHCENCLRITIGTAEENKKLIEVLMSMQ